MKIRISWKNGEAMGELNGSPTAQQVAQCLPHESMANTWGEEVYFSVPVRAELASDAKEVVPAGTICFWTQGQSLAIPFGRTPASESDECRLVTAVNIVGKLEGDPQILASVQAGDNIRVEAYAKN